jgi:ArsR family transcriptional regulator
MSAFETLHTTLKLLSDPTRLRILALLSLEELAVHELVTVTGMAQSRISNQLSLLKRSGLVKDRREGTWSFHRLVPTSSDGPLTPEMYDAALRPYRDSADGRADALALEAVREQRRERSRKVHDALAERWAEVGQEFVTGSLRLEALAALVPSGLTVADLGCGAGYLTSFLVARGARVIAVDHSANMLDAARRSTSRAGVEFRAGEMESLPLADGEVDAAFANLVWHHLADMDGAARELARVVREGGTAVITDLLPHDQEWMREHLGDLRLGIQPDAVVATMARAGFRSVSRENLQDQYVVRGPDGRSTALPMFLVRGVRPAAFE